MNSMTFRKMVYSSYFVSLVITILIVIFFAFQMSFFYFIIFLVVGGIGVLFGMALLYYIFNIIEIKLLEKRYSARFDTLPNILKFLCGIFTFFRCGFYSLWIILPFTSPFRIISLYNLGISEDMFFIFLLSFYLFLFFIEYLLFLVKWSTEKNGINLDPIYSTQVSQTEKVLYSDEFIKIDISEIEGINFIEKNSKKYSLSLPSIKRIASYIQNKYHKNNYLPEELRGEYNMFITYFSINTDLSPENFEILKNTFGGFVAEGGEFEIIRK